MRAKRIRRCGPYNRASTAHKPTGEQGMSANKALIVMVHGSWHWGGCFHKVADLLAQRGYPVVTPDLKSHGYDATPYNAVTDMDDYCAPVEEIIVNAAEPVVLLGHS